MVFRNVVSPGEIGVLEGLRGFIYVGGGLTVSAFAITRWLPDRASPLLPFLMGILLTGALVSLMIGVLLLPVTLTGILVLVGLLGLTPFFTATVLFRSSLRIWRRGHLYRTPITSLIGVFCGIFLLVTSAWIADPLGGVCHPTRLEQQIVGLWVSDTQDMRFLFFPNRTYFIQSSQYKERHGVYRAISKTSTLEGTHFYLSDIGWRIEFNSEGKAFLVNYLPTDGVYTNFEWKRKEIQTSAFSALQYDCRWETLRVNFKQLSRFP